MTNNKHINDCVQVNTAPQPLSHLNLEFAIDDQTTVWMTLKLIQSVDEFDGS